MQKTAFIALVTTAALAFGSLAQAQPNGHGGDPELPRHGQSQPQDRQDARHMQDNRQGPGHQRQDQDQSRHGRPDFAQERGAGPEHNFRRGGRLPREYRNNQYVVDDWRGHHLSAPPRGYHWVQTGGDYVLIAITTGIIAQILLGNY